MHIVAVPVLGILINTLLQCVEANLMLDFRVTRISASHKPANCNVANTTYAHGETFKLDCKTQCVCENGRHACSSLCPKEQLPAPEDTISCRSPRLVEVPGHCCKMWLCENPTADVYATCHNSSTSPWTPCNRKCGLGISTRFTTTTAGCNQLSNLRLCENRKCETLASDMQQPATNQQPEPEPKDLQFVTKAKPLKYKTSNGSHRQRKHQRDFKYHQQAQQEHLEPEHRIRKGHECRSLQRLGPARIRLGQCVSKKLYRPKICGRCHKNTKCCVPSVSTTIQVELLCPLNAMDPISFVQQQLNREQKQQQQQQEQEERKEQSLPFYPKTAISFSDSSSSSSSTSSTAAAAAAATVPASMASLWDTHSLDAIDQEYLQSHQIQIANKFIAVEWILKCECTKADNCQRIVNTTAATRGDGDRHVVGSSSNNSRGISNINIRKYHDYDDNENVDMGNNLSGNNYNNNNMQNINYFQPNHKNNYNYRSSKWKNSMHYEDYKQRTGEGAATQIDKKIPDGNKNVDKPDEKMAAAEDEKENDAHNESDININSSYSNGNRNINRRNHSRKLNRKKQTKDYANNKKKNSSLYKNKSNMINSQTNDDDNEDLRHNGKGEREWSTSLSSSLLSASSSAVSSDEIQPDIIPYPPPPFSANKHASKSNQKHDNNNNKNNIKNTQTDERMKDTFKLEHSKQNKKHQHQQQQQQAYYEHWLLQQYSNKPYQIEGLAT